MPYIKDERREALALGDIPPDNPGELNFCLTMKMLDYLNFHGTSYSTLNDIVGAVEGAKLEFYRRVAAPYEDAKIEANGDVY